MIPDRFLFTLVFFTFCGLQLGCGKVFYQTRLQPEQQAVICGYSVPWERQECLEEANEQIEWCKEALSQEDDCWNTLLGDASRFRKEYPVNDQTYFQFLKDPVSIKPLLDRIKREHPLH
jgi:hypothetical protein